MIELDLSTFFVVVVVAAFLLVGVSSLWWRLREWRDEAKARHRTIRCRYCGTLFEQSPRRAQVEHCPGCRASIQSGRDRRLG